VTPSPIQATNRGRQDVEHIEGSDEFQPVGILTVLQLMTCMDVNASRQMQ
jgi:hypothetical protein